MTRKTLLATAIFLLIGSIAQIGFAQQKPSPEMVAANELVKQKKWAEAEIAFEKIVITKPKNGRAWFSLGFARHSQNKFADAIRAFEKHVEISKSSISMYNIAAGYSRMKNPDKSFEWLEKALNNGAAFSTNIDTDKDFDNIKTDARFAKMQLLVKQKRNPCMYSAKARQFDFWIGDWEVFVRGRKVGENLVELDTQGCVLVENWTNSGGGKGKSLNVYNASIKKWQQFYVGGQGGVIEFKGEYREKKKIMYFTAVTAGPKGTKIMHIFTFSDLPDKTVRQWWQQSTDGGKTYNTVWDSIYKKRIKKK